MEQQANLANCAQAGKKLLTGHIDLVNFSVPVKMFEPRSYLEKLADVWVYPDMLSQAADATDPIARMKFVITWYDFNIHALCYTSSAAQHCIPAMSQTTTEQLANSMTDLRASKPSQ